MRYRLLAMLILTSWVQVEADETLPPEPSHEIIVVGVNVMVGGRRQMREITMIRAASPAPADEDDEQPPRPVMRLKSNTAVVGRENFDRWLFADGRSEKARRRYLEVLLERRIEVVALVHKLADSQRVKLLLAGRGDIKRFFDQVEDRRNAFEIARKSYRTGVAALQRLDDLSRIYQRGPFGAGSLFAKTLQKITNDQKAGR
jgi:hypothetical protein